jgi:hypothetical protein
MLPALALMFSALLVLVLPQDFKAKLGMVMAAFVGTIFLQLSIGGRVPVLEILTYWDLHLMISYVAIALLIAQVFLDSSLEEKGALVARKQLLFWSRIVIPTSWLAAQAILALVRLA